MADESFAGDESKIVTQFLLGTCRLLQPSIHRVNAAAVSAKQLTHTPLLGEVAAIPQITGSVSEFYIHPMLSCFGDVDMMTHFSDELAIPAGYPPPTQLPAEFHSRVNVYEIIDSEYPGYVYLVSSYLVTENTHVGTYDAVQCRRRYYYYGYVLSAYQYMSYFTELEIHGPAAGLKTYYRIRTGETDELQYELVPCMRCLSWPTQAADWPTRHRDYGWPDSETVNCVVSNGCDVVRVAHRLCRQDEWASTHQHRLSFSRAEIVLLNSWIPVQQIVYHMLRFFVKTERLTDITDSSGAKILSNYHLKTLMLWACELKPRSWWIVDFNVVRICVELLHVLSDWFKNNNCPHYFVNNYCSLIDTLSHVEVIVSQLSSITESWLSTWFVNNYLRKCAPLCPYRISRLFDEVSTSMKLQNAVSAVVAWKINSAMIDLWGVWNSAALTISNIFDPHSLTVRHCDYLISELTKIDLCPFGYFAAVAFLHVAYKAALNGLNDELIDVITTTLGKFDDKRRYCNQLSSVSSLNQAAKLMNFVANRPNWLSTLHLIEIELSKAYLYRALRCKDSDSDSIYCLANFYLAVLYYTTGHYQTAIDHCTLVMRSQDHSQCSSHVVQGELLPKIDDDIDTVLGLAVYYQYVRTAALNHKQQTHHVSVFTTELFACYLHIRCLSVMKCRPFTQMSSGIEGQRYRKYCLVTQQPYIDDILLLKSVALFSQKCHDKPLSDQTIINLSDDLDTSELVELLQQSAVENLTIFRQLEAQMFGSVATIVTTDFEALYAYKRGDYQRSLQLSTQNVRTLLYGICLQDVIMFADFGQLLDDDIVSLTALTLIADPKYRIDACCRCRITQLALSLYLMTQCQLKLCHSMKSMAQTLHFIKLAQRKLPVYKPLDQLTLKLIERKVMLRLASIM